MVQPLSEENSKPLLVWHLPEDGSNKNAYGRLMMANLEALGVNVVPVAYRHLFVLRALGERPDLVHFQSITPFLLPASRSGGVLKCLVKAPAFLAQVMMLKLLGCRIVWTVHNLHNHEQRLASLERFFSVLFARLADSLIIHSDSAKRRAIAAFRLQRRPGKLAVIFHPSYIDAYPNSVSREEARARLGLDMDRRMALVLGQLRPYKGLREVVSAFQALELPKFELWIVGEPADKNLTAELRDAAAATGGLRLHAAHVDDEQLQCYLNACDVVVFAYRSILTSGGALLAMSFGRACVAPDLEPLLELLDDGGAIFFRSGDAGAVEKALASAAALSDDQLSAMGAHNLNRARDWTWPKAAQRVLTIYRETLSPRAASQGSPL